MKQVIYAFAILGVLLSGSVASAQTYDQEMDSINNSAREAYPSPDTYSPQQQEEELNEQRQQQEQQEYQDRQNQIQQEQLEQMQEQTEQLRQMNKNMNDYGE